MESGCDAVNNKECNVDMNERAESPLFSVKSNGDQKKSLCYLETKLREEREDVSIHDSDLESLMNSPTLSNMGHDDSREGFGGSTGSSSTSGFSESLSEEEEDGCVDNWEDLADALSADCNQYNPATDAPAKSERRVEFAGADQQLKNQEINQSNLERRQCVSHMNCRAWRPDDAFRPQSLPSLLKQHNISLISDWHNGQGTNIWEQKSTMSDLSSCPICYEDLDVTDSSFLPCLCGFRLCLFCHKRILETDGRCPGCRKCYDTNNGNNICFSR